MHMHIRYHFLADLHVTRQVHETEIEKRVQNTPNKPFRVELVTSQNRDYRPHAISEHSFVIYHLYWEFTDLSRESQTSMNTSDFHHQQRWKMTTTGFISHVLLTSISISLYLDSFSVNFAEVLLSDRTAMSMGMHLLYFLSLTTVVGLLVFIFLSVFTGISQSIVTSLFSVNVVGWCSYHFSVV